MRDAFVAALAELAESDPRIMLVTGDLGFGVIDGFARRFPNQYLNVGVAEQNMTGVATGLALSGRTVFTYSIGNFPILRCLEQIRNDAAYHNASVKVVGIGGGFTYGSLGMSHHATEDLAILRALPIDVVAPGDDAETIAATQALAKREGTAYLRLDRIGPNVEGGTFEFGKVRKVREGTAATLVATGGILGVTVRAADQLAEQGIQCRVLSVHSLRPFDEEAIVAAAVETGGIVTVEEHTVVGGLGGVVAETCLEAGQPPRFFHRVGLRAGFSSVVGSQDYLRAHYGVNEEAIIAAVTARVA